jgi:hypothetical protein
MPIASTDVLLKLSTTAGAAGNANPGTVGQSLGKYVSTTQVSATALNDIFPDLTGAQNAASQVDYQCVFVHNNHATLTASNVSLFGTSDVAGGATWQVGADTTAASSVGATPAQALTIANSTTAPAGVSFSAPTTDGAGVSLGALAPGQVKAFWIKRSAANTAALNGDGFTINVAFDTPA